MEKRYWEAFDQMVANLRTVARSLSDNAEEIIGRHRLHNGPIRITVEVDGEKGPQFIRVEEEILGEDIYKMEDGEGGTLCGS